MEKISVIAVTGATATGKSELAMRLAALLGGEIISGDSMQIYKGMDIGTAKPTPAERAAVKHHLIDIAEIDESFSVAAVIEKAGAAARDIAARGRTPIIAGGTGLYIDLLISGRVLTATGSAERLRAQLFERAEREGAYALHRQLEAIDPDSARAIHPNNIKRVVRAIEIYTTTGFTKTRQDELSRQSESAFNCTHIHLAYSDRQLLYDRINARVDRMLEAGLENEVSALYSRGLAETVTASQAIGYKEFFPYFEGKADLAVVTDEIKKNTRNYAKRQTTYFNRMEKRVEIDISGKDTEDIFRSAYEICGRKG